MVNALSNWLRQHPRHLSFSLPILLNPFYLHPFLSFHKSNSPLSALLLRHLTMHAFSSATLEASLCHLPAPDLAMSPPLLASFPHFISSHSSSFSSLLASDLAPMLEPSGLLPSELSYSCSSGPCSSYGSPTSKPQRSMSHGPGIQISTLFDLESSVRRAYSSSDLQVCYMSHIYSNQSNPKDL